MNKKIIYKPWGKEMWLELNEFYCYKRIYINKGYRTSLQYHKNKIETNYLISGQAKLFLEDDAGNINESILNEGDYVTINPPKIHRIEAITDIILQEVSTPEVDDVVRIQDDSNRDNGVIKNEKLNPVFVILAAGLGSRMGELTTNTNKCLLPVGGVAIISKIINNVPKDYEIIILVGYQSHLVKSYCNIAHTDRNITYVEVDRYIGVGSGPGHSISQAKDLLQRPFYVAVGDGYIDDDLPPLDYNWIGINKLNKPELYSTVDLDEDQNVIHFKNKSKSGYDWACSGLFGMLDYRVFWDELETNMSTEGEIVSAFYNIEDYKKIKGKNFKWHDIGNIEDYKKLNSGLIKTDGSNTYITTDNIIKTFPDKTVCSNKIKRAKILGDLIPKIETHNEFTYSYKKIEGVTLYNTDLSYHMPLLLDWLSQSVWKDYIECDVSNYDDFYQNKTMKRLDGFLAKKNITYKEGHIVNTVITKPIDYYITRAFKELKEWDGYGSHCTKNFHGDLQFDNIILTAEGGKYMFIDWRDTFGKTIEGGDLYYDLAKMYGGILMPYNKMKSDENYDILFINEYEIEYNHTTEPDSLRIQFEKWIVDNGYNLKIIKLITALIYLNMSPLHEDKLDDILFFKSKLMFNTIFDDNN